jgi:hypothetical protein
MVPEVVDHAEPQVRERAERERHLLGRQARDQRRVVDRSVAVVDAHDPEPIELSNIETNIDRSERMRVAAEDSDESQSHSVVTYLGFDAPDDLAQATSGKYAQDAKDGLSSFQEGLRATHEGREPSNNTVMGYSYGAVVTGHTGSGPGLHADQVVLIGAPGPGEGVDHAQDLGVGAENVHYTTADNDVIRAAEATHGPRLTPPLIPGGPLVPIPQGKGGFGGNEFSSDAAYDMSPFDAHASYWRRGNEALDNFGHIIAGNHGEVSR